MLHGLQWHLIHACEFDIVCLFVCELGFEENVYEMVCVCVCARARARVCVRVCVCVRVRVHVCVLIGV